MEKGPQDIAALEWLVNMGMALLGGAVRFLKEWRENLAVWDRKRIFLEGMINGLQGGLAALLAFLILKSWNVDQFYSAFACGIMGHMGPEGIALLKDVVTNGLRARANPPAPKE